MRTPAPIADDILDSGVTGLVRISKKNLRLATRGTANFGVEFGKALDEG
jgi:hypothetical protein